MTNEFNEFQIRTPSGRTITSITGRLRDAVVAVHQSLSMVDPVVSAYLNGEQSIPVVKGHMDGRGQIRIDRYLTSGSGTEFENWSDAYHHAAGWLPGEGWRIAQFVTFAPPSGVLGRAELTVGPNELSETDFAGESWSASLALQWIHHRCGPHQTGRDAGMDGKLPTERQRRANARSDRHPCVL